MASYADSGIDWAALWRDNRGDVGQVAFVVTFVASIILGAFVTPFHYLDALIMFAVAAGPALLVLAVFAGLGDRLASRFESANASGAMNAMAGVVLVLVVSPGNLLLWANERLDRSPATVEVASIVEKWTRFGRGRTTYLAGVTTDVRSPLGEHSLYGAQPVALTKTQWERLAPGTSRLLLREHRGAFGVRWFEPNVEVQN